MLALPDVQVGTCLRAQQSHTRGGHVVPSEPPFDSPHLGSGGHGGRYSFQHFVLERLPLRLRFPRHLPAASPSRRRRHCRRQPPQQMPPILLLASGLVRSATLMHRDARASPTPPPGQRPALGGRRDDDEAGAEAWDQEHDEQGQHQQGKVEEAGSCREEST